jgi:hypothetical protein
MRAMQIIEWGKPLEAREYPDPVPKGEEVLLRVEAAGVCHSDVHIWDGHFDLGGGHQISLESRGVHLPFTMGHEIAGEVAALGPRSPFAAARTASKRRIKTQTVLPSAETAAMLFWALLASGQITMRKVDGWQSLTQKLADNPIDLAA